VRVVPNSERDSAVFDSATRKAVPIQISYKDTTGYFSIYFNKPSAWVVRVVTEGRQPWVGFNVDESISAPLIPANFKRLDAHPFAEFRVAISGPQDLPALSRLVDAAFQKTIADRKPPKDPAGAAAKMGS
jgi:hypothetical protein